MKSFLKFRHLFLIVVCAVPLLANATAIDVSHPGHQNFKKIQVYSHGSKKKPANSCCTGGEHGFLLPDTGANDNLAKGTYQFGQFESSFSKNFSDQWTFSLAEVSQVNLTLFKTNQSGGLSHLLNTTNLELELFDASNHSLGSITGNHSLNLLLAADTQYSFVVSGSVHGLLGGFYLGSLQACPTPTTTPTSPVPIGGAFPMFTAALLALGGQFRIRRRLRQS